MRILALTMEFAFISLLWPWTLAAKEKGFVSACNYSAQETSLRAQEEACSKNVGQEWSCEIHRCMTKKDVLDMRESFQACLSAADEKEQKNCHYQVAQKYSGSISNSDSTPYAWMTRFAYGASITLAIFMLAGSERGHGCKSRIAFQVASAAALGSEIYLYITTQNRLKEIQEKYEKMALNDNAYDAQAEAFKAMIDEQTTIEDISKKRRLLYAVTGGAYALSAAIAAIELATPSGTWNKCKVEQSNRQKVRDRFGEIKNAPERGGLPQVPGSSQYHQDRATTDAATAYFTPVAPASWAAKFGPWLASWAFAPAWAKAKDPMGDKTSYLGLLLGAGTAAGLMQISQVRNYLYQSQGILTVAAIASSLSFLMMAEADSQASEADQNKRKIKKILEQFKADNAVFCPNGHDQLEEPRCYCYNDDGSKNTNHANSETCQSMWAAQNTSLLVDETKYNRGGNYQTGCVTQDGVYDEECKCKRVINRATKQNYCLKATTMNNDLSTLPAGWGVNNITQDLDKVGDGTLLGGDVQAAANEQQVANLKNAVNKLLKKSNPKAADPFGDPAAEKMVNQIATQEIKDKARDGAAASAAMPASHKSFVADSPKARRAAEQAGISNGLKIIDAKSLKPAAKKTEEEEFNFNGGYQNDSNNVIIDEFKTKDDAEYTFANQDIRDQDTDLFRAISLRYQQTGLRALFGQEKTNPPIRKPQVKNKKEATTSPP